jgi:outer membrane receptor for ferrienterochelin and colicins
MINKKMKKFHNVLALVLCANATNVFAVQDNSQDTTGYAGIYNLQQVVVTGNGHHELMKNSTTPVHVLTATDIAKAGITGFQAALTRMMPNVQFAPSSMGSYIRLNGLGNKYILILINGQKVVGDISGNVDLNQIDMAQIKRIEVLNGAASALYGSDAIGGVVNIITNQPKDKLISAVSDTRVGAKGAFTQNANLNIHTKWLSSYTSFSHNEVDSWRHNNQEYTGSEPEGETALSLQPLVVGYHQNLIRQRFELHPISRLLMYAEGSYNYKMTDRPRKQEGWESGYDYDMRFKTQRWAAGAKYEFNDNHSLQVDFLSHTFRYGNEYMTDVESKGVITNYVGEYTQSKKQSLYDLEVKNINHFYEGSTTIFGGEWKNDFLNATSGDVDNHVYNLSAYAQHDTKLLDNMSVTAGVRYDYNEAFGNHVSPKVALLYRPGAFSFRANYALGFRAPGMDELYYHYYKSNMRGKPVVTFGNKDLNPETSNYVSLSAGYGNSLFSIDVTGYLNYVNNMIIKDVVEIDEAAKQMLLASFPDDLTEASFTKMTTYNRYLNSDKGIIRGVNANVCVYPYNGLTLSANYAYTYATTKTGGEWIPLERTVKNAVTLAANYNHTWGKTYTLNVNLNGRMQSKTYYPGYEDAPGYGVWNLNTTHNFVLSKYLQIEPSVGIDNIFNKIDNRIDWTNRRYANYNPGTSVVFGVKVKFN